MKFLGNLIWFIFGGFEAALGYFTASFVLAITIIGIPWALQTVKLGLLCLWPFGSDVKADNTSGGVGCLNFALNIVWLIFGGLWAFACHIFFGLLLCITLIGIPWGKQHFKMAKLSLTPFGKTVNIGL